MRHRTLASSSTFGRHRERRGTQPLCRASWSESSGSAEHLPLHRPRVRRRFSARGWTRRTRWAPASPRRTRTRPTPPPAARGAPPFPFSRPPPRPPPPSKLGRTVCCCRCFVTRRRTSLVGGFAVLLKSIARECRERRKCCYHILRTAHKSGRCGLHAPGHQAADGACSCTKFSVVAPRTVVAAVACYPPPPPPSRSPSR